MGPTCVICGANLISGVLEGADGAIERVCPSCQPDHPLSVAVWNAQAMRDPLLSDKLTIEIYGHNMPSTEVWVAVSKFIRETFSDDWMVSLNVDEKDQPNDDT